MSRLPSAKRESLIEVFMPFGMRLFSGLYWVAGLSGMMLGLIVLSDGFFESYYDIQIMLIAQGVALLVLASLMFLVAVGMVTGARWSLNFGKRLTAISVGWSVVGIVLAVYSAYDLTGVEYLLVLYGVVGWLLAFGLVVGLAGLRYLSAAGTTIRKYAEYVTTEPLSLQPIEGQKRLPVIRRPVIRCIDCGTELKKGMTTCPECGATQSIGK